MSSDKQHACYMCEKTFGRKLTLTRHLAISHKVLALFRCSRCNQHFDTEYRSKLHRMTCGTEGEREKCKYLTCNHECHPSKMGRHFARCHSRIEEISCPCGNSFFDKYGLERHRRICLWWNIR